jgi:hypothetical protein
VAVLVAVRSTCQRTLRGSPAQWPLQAVLRGRALGQRARERADALREASVHRGDAAAERPSSSVPEPRRLRDPAC